MAQTIFDLPARRALLARIDRLSPDTPARWGRFTAPRMVSHLVAAIGMGLGDVAVVPHGGVMRIPAIRYLIIHVMPWPKGAPTAPEMLARIPASWPADIAALKVLVERAAANEAGHWHPHPAFGTLSARDWGALIHRHVAHHLTQFGC
ncbi:MAG: DUF1569 domain-containing protein [Gemmatimonadaceae bacterium]